MTIKTINEDRQLENLEEIKNSLDKLIKRINNIKLDLEDVIEYIEIRKEILEKK